MLRKIGALTIGLITIVSVSLVSFGIWKTVSERPTFYTSGYVLQGDSLEAKQTAFDGETTFVSSKSGVVSFSDMSGQQTSVPEQSFVHFEDGSVMAFTDGVLIDFADLSDNFINNYQITSMLRVQADGAQYTAETTVGTITFGENLWKLSDQKYLIQSPTLTVHFSDDDERLVSDYVQISVSDDGIVNILTVDNVWATISENFYIETEGGVQINPVTQLITDGNYTMSMAKLSVNADDMIVLTEDETRRQIVPELTFEVINGEDGESGVAGQAGTSGSNGVAGVDGITGEQGQAGQTGEDGEIGEDGASGEDGVIGVTGTTGDDGSKGSSGSSGSDGEDGAKGIAGASGATGADATGDSSTNSALPTFTVTNWDLTATSIAGTFSISDVAGYLTNDLFTYYNNDYPATVTIYNNSTGESILCYMASYNSTSGYSVDTFYDTQNFNTGNSLFDEAELHFILPDGEYLEPNTSYQLIAEAYYMMNYDVYSRKFINETFYTDSAGVYLVKELATTSSLDINAIVSSAYQQTVEKIEVVLLTASQLNDFTFTTNLSSNASDATGYTQKYVLDYNSGTATYFSSESSNGTQQNSVYVDLDGTSLNFSGLDSNTTYYARIIVTNSGLTSLSDQTLELMTLKTTPTWSSTPYAYYNRVSGQVDVYRPSVTDDDGAVTEYVYTPYQYVNGEWVALTSQQQVMQSYTSGAATFSLTTGYYYYFKVTMVTYNNEQTVEYNLGETESIYVQAGSLPGLELTGDYDNTYDEYDGTLKIKSDIYTTMSVGSSQQLKFVIKGDLVNSETISFSAITADGIQMEGSSEVTVNGESTYMYIITLQESVEGSEYIADLDFNGLLQNTQYTITVSAYLDFDTSDNVAATSYELGTVSFRTYDTPDATASWSTIAGDGTSVISENVSISLLSSGYSDYEVEHAKEQLLDGQVTIELQSSSSTKAQGTALITGDDLAKLYSSEGLTLTEGSFGKTDVDTSANLDIVITEVADSSIWNESTLGYYNTFELYNSSKDVYFNQSLPSLTTSPQSAIVATPITKSTASNYSVDKTNYSDLPDDAIVGYALSSTFDNSDRMGKTLTFYAIDYSQFYNLVVLDGSSFEFDLSDQTSMDTLGLNIASEITIDISTAATVPSVAIFFGNAPGDSRDYDGEAQFSHNSASHSVYYAGNAQLYGSAQELQYGMERGYCYLFAYTATIDSADSDVDYNYPLDRADYESYKNSYGTGLGLTKDIAATKTYMLNSGVQYAPLVEPQIYSYVSSTSDDVYEGSSTSGSLVLKYAYSDVDNVVTSDTTISHSLSGIPGFTGKEIGSSMETTSVWNSIALDYYVANTASSVVLTPTVNFELYKANYSNAILNLTGEELNETYYLATIPVDWYWGGGSYLTKPSFEMKIDNENNQITFRSYDMSTYLKNRAYGVEVSFYAPSVGTQTLYVGLTQDGNDGSYYAQISTALLSDFLGVEFTVSTSVMYDNGTQGWDMVEDGEMFALQVMTVSGTDAAETAEFGNYVGYSSTAISPSFKLMSQLYSSDSASTFFTTQRLENNTNNPTYDSFGNKDGFHTGFKYLSTEDGTLNVSSYLYIQATANGVYASSKGYIVPKGVSALSATMINNSSSGTITSIVPTVDYDSSKIYTATSNGFTLRDFDITAFEDIGYEEVYFKLFFEDSDNVGYPDYDNEINLQNGYADYVTLNEKGNYTVDDATDEGKFQFDIDDINDKTQVFYIVVYMKDENGTEYQLLKSSGDLAEYKFYFATDIVFTPVVDSTTELVVLYENTSYFNKYISFEYTMNRYDEVSVEYSILDSDYNPVISHSELVANELYGSSMSFENLPEYISVNISLKPGDIRSRLELGKTYYVQVTATDGGDTYITEYSFTLPKLIETGASISVVNASSEELTYQVTITDTEYVIMGSTYSGEDYGLYAVRFTDSKGNQIFTQYDDQLFKAGEPRQQFVLSEDTLTGYMSTEEKFELGIDEEYWINIYAVLDTNVDGYGPDIGDVTEGLDYYQKEWKDFFLSNYANAGTDYTFSPTSTIPFNTFLNTAWVQNSGQDGSVQNTATYEKISAAFNISSYSQTTIESDGLLIQKYNIARSGNRFRLTFTESFGVISASGEQAFDQVQWTVTGVDSTGNSITYNGMSYDSLGDAMFVESETALGTTYYYEIPMDFDIGQYTIVIQPYVNGVKYETAYDTVITEI